MLNKPLRNWFCCLQMVYVTCIPFLESFVLVFFRCLLMVFSHSLCLWSSSILFHMRWLNWEILIHFVKPFASQWHYLKLISSSIHINVIET